MAGVGFGRVVRYPLYQYYHQYNRLHDIMRIVDRISIHATRNMFVFPLPSPSTNRIGLPHASYVGAELKQWGELTHGSGNWTGVAFFSSSILSTRMSSLLE